MKVKFNGKTYQCPENTLLLDFFKGKVYDENMIIAGLVDNKLVDLNYKLHRDCCVGAVDIKSEEGMKVYRRSMSFVFIRAVRELFPEARVTIEHSLGKGLYCEVHKDHSLNKSDVALIKRKMDEIVSKNMPFERIKVSIKQAIDIFNQQGQPEKVKLLKYSTDEKMYLYRLNGYYDYFYGILAPHTGYLKVFDLKFYLPGVIIMFPDMSDPKNVAEFVDQHKLAAIYQETEKWGRIMRVDYVSSLNELIESGDIKEIIRIAEALHEKKIAQIADLVSKNRDNVRLILIAGPSSSGKTTFAQRLYIQLRVNGLRPISISLDDYFLPSGMIPKDENGKYDFENIEALDLELFNEQLAQLIQGEEVVLPKYDFATGSRIQYGRKVKIDKDQPIIIEGIHGLNERLTSAIPKDRKFKIYISALTQLNLDDHNRIPTTDSRLVRRIVRDYMFRATDAEKTLEMWSSVRRGEEKNIFPYQEEADVMFNSALVYELGVLKKYAEPLLLKVKRSSGVFYMAQYLLDILSYIRPIRDEQDIPANSILREFIGNSCFF
uniref:nucleoside kinase n=1 Tax=Caldanaerobius polysaccharolyticus TaxID=44256 RepID=UPI00047C7887